MIVRIEDRLCYSIPVAPRSGLLGVLKLAYSALSLIVSGMHCRTRRVVHS